MSKVLIIDDDTDNRTILRARLERAGHQVFEADNGESGIQMANSESPDAVILDAMMPKLDGWLTCRMLKSNDATKGIPILMLTACSRKMEEMRGWECGADEFLTKPCDPARLIAFLSDHAAQAGRAA